MLAVSISVAGLTRESLKWCNRLRRKSSQKCIPWVLDVISAVAPGELFSTDGCNYTAATVRAFRVVVCLDLHGDHRTTWWTQKAFLESAARSGSPPPSLPPAAFSSVSSFSPVSGWRQAGPLRAFKRLLKVLVRHGPYPSAATHTVHPVHPQSPLSNHSFSACQLALL